MLKKWEKSFYFRIDKTAAVRISMFMVEYE